MLFLHWGRLQAVLGNQGSLARAGRRQLLVWVGPLNWGGAHASCSARAVHHDVDVDVDVDVDIVPLPSDAISIESDEISNGSNRKLQNLQTAEKS